MPEITSTSTSASSRAAAHEGVAVFGFAHRARRDGAQRRTFGFGDASHVCERGDAAVHRLRLEPFHVARTRTEAHHLALTSDDFEAIVRRDAGDDEMDRVGADVDRGKRGVGLDRRAVRHDRDATLRPVVTAFVLINAEPSRIATLAQQLSDLKGVGEVYSVAGDEDLVAIVRVEHHDELAEVVTQRISALEGIVATRTLIAFQAYSKHDLDAMWSIGWE